MRRGHARGGEGAAAMRSALQLALVLLACLSCGSGDNSTTVTSPATSTIITTARPTTRAKSSEAASTPTAGAGIVGSSPSLTKTTAKASSATTVAPVGTKGTVATTPKGTTQSLGTLSPTPSGVPSKLTTAKPATSPVIGTNTQRTGATTALVTPTVVTSLALSSTVSSGDPALSTSSSSDSSGKATVTSPKPKGTSPSLAPTASKATTTTAVHATSGKGGPVIIPVTTTVTTGGAVSTTAPKRVHTSPKGAIPTTVITSGGTKGSTAPQPPPAFSTTSDLTRRTSVTIGTAVTPPESHGSPFPTGGSKQDSCAAHTKIICESVRPSEYQGILLTMNESRSCESLENMTLKDSLMNVFCKAVKPNFNQSRDVCTANVAPVADHPQKLAVLSISVTLCFLGDELSESLAVKKGELEKLGFSDFIYGGKTPDIDGEDRFGMPLIITIVCMAASLLLVAAIYGCCHQRISRRKDQQRLTEELQTMENGYHDNPTLEVMETSAEMQEKKVNLNGELGDSWIVPMDSLTKEDLEEEEDTHL